MKITLVEHDSIAEELGIQVGDELLEINGTRARDAIDYRFHESDEQISLKIAHQREVVIYDIEKDEDDRVGLDFEDMKILSCGNDCIFCFVDQNPQGLRKELYFRDGDYRLSFMYGNYTTLTNAGPAILDRIITEIKLLPNTPAAVFGSAVEPRVRFKRNKMLRILGQKKKRAFYDAMVGKSALALMEGDVDCGIRYGFTENYVRIGLPADKTAENAIVSVEITGTENEKCVGRILETQVAA